MCHLQPFLAFQGVRSHAGRDGSGGAADAADAAAAATAADGAAWRHASLARCSTTRPGSASRRRRSARGRSGSRTACWALRRGLRRWTRPRPSREQQRHPAQRRAARAPGLRSARKANGAGRKLGGPRLMPARAVRAQRRDLRRQLAPSQAFCRSCRDLIGPASARCRDGHNFWSHLHVLRARARVLHRPPRPAAGHHRPCPDAYHQQLSGWAQDLCAALPDLPLPRPCPSLQLGWAQHPPGEDGADLGRKDRAIHEGTARSQVSCGRGCCHGLNRAAPVE